MKAIIRDYPIFAIALMLLACVKFEYQTDAWSVSSSGLPAGLIVLAAIAIVLLYRIFNAAQDALIARGLLRTKVRCKYDLLLPIGILAVAIHGQWRGAPFHGAGQSGYDWEFAWSDPDWAVPFIAALIGVLLLVRILYLFREIARTANRNA